VVSGQVELAGVRFDAVTGDQAVRVVRAALRRGEGGRILTPNVDILRRDARVFARDASLVVADGMPIVWASRLAGTPLPARVAGSDLIWSLCEALTADQRSVLLIGGRVSTVESGAQRAAGMLRRTYPGLCVDGIAPPHGFTSDARLFKPVRDAVVAARPDLVCVGLGYPRQEHVISRLRRLLPSAWYLGCGAAIDFVAGDRSRAPRLFQRSGLEWLYRLGQEPGRLADRYLRRDIPYAVALLVGAALAGRLATARPRKSRQKRRG
jgi:N-acetylglucosaminyldiphosphoundecaprenol N-acetyl-beta-D-mannosaminyltransferase